MDKLKQILRTTLTFLIIYLLVSVVFSFFQDDSKDQQIASGSLIIETTKGEYGVSKSVQADIINYTDQAITIPNCPAQILSVSRYQQNEWLAQTLPEEPCSGPETTILEPGKQQRVSFDKWQHAIFGDQGRFRLELQTEINGELKTITSNEFSVVDDGLIRQLWNGTFYRPIYNGLIFIASQLPGHNLGWAVIILTLAIRTILLVPSRKAIQSQRKMQEMQPRLDKIKEKYKGDQQRIAMETMAIWKEEQISPLSSCMPILLQLPFLLAVFYVVRDSINPDNAYLLYTTYENFSLANINHIFFGLDLTTPNRYVLPLIVGALQFIQMQMMMAKNKNNSKKGPKEMQMAQGTMSYIMPVMIAVFTATVPAGVGIYWGTSTLYGIIQQTVIIKTARTKKNPEVRVRVVEQD